MSNKSHRTPAQPHGSRTQSSRQDSSSQDSARPHITREDLYQRLSGVSLADEARFRRRLKKARSKAALSAISGDLAEAEAQIQRRLADKPQITYPQNLPVSEYREQIRQAIEQHQVVVIAGETGSGKTTQLPKICLELGRGIRGMIGHTQPRRIAARSVAARIADELGEDLGNHVGYSVRFDDRTSTDTAVKLMTDGILLQEIQRDRWLRNYDTIIIDEAHERSLNIDFLLGYLKQLLPKRPDLKVIITSATIDPEAFAEHFSDKNGTPAPIIEVSGRTYPVEVRYRPLVTTTTNRNGETVEQDIEQIDGVVSACQELMREGDGDILCFFASEREIRDTAETINGLRWRGVEVVPLFGRLSNQEQQKIFAPHSGRRIVLATNIAETSVTVPGIRYVVDTGLARISRYSTRTKVQRLPIEEISQASAAQRSGRCGRLSDGIAIRLYSEDDFLARPEFTDPEILRTNLAGVILQMAELGIGDIADFPFIDAPDAKAIRDGIALLFELQALHTDNATQKSGVALTKVGSQLARIPVDPRLARMLIAARTHDVLGAVIVIVSALSLPDVRERPLEFQAQADQAHARFRDPASDFCSFLKLWNYLNEQRDDLSGNQFRKLCRREFLNYLRVREWQDLVRQLSTVVRDLGWTRVGTKVLADADTADVDAIHRSLLAGLLSYVGHRDTESKEFLGTRNTKFLIHPGSALAKKPPQWVMAAEVVETSRLFARNVGAIQPEWIVQQAAHLIKYNYSEPHWSSKRGAAMVYQKSLFLGLTLVADRLVPLSKVDAPAARAMFIRHALVEGQWRTHHKFYEHNRNLLEEAAQVEEKMRRRGLVADDDALFAFYDTRIPETITSAAHFDAWWKKKRHQSPELLNFDPSALLNPEATEASEVDFPDVWQQGSLNFTLSYEFSPGAKNDGVTVHIPVPLLAGVENRDFDWLVPGLRLELLEALIRTLPKALRRGVVPAPDFARRAHEIMTPYERPITEAFADALRRLGGSGINATDFDVSKLPDHLRCNFAAIDRRGAVIDQDRDLVALQSRRASQVRSAVSQAAASSEQPAVKKWTAENLGTIPETVERTVDGQKVVAYPTLVQTDQGVAVQVMPTQQQAQASLATTCLTMLLRDLPVSVKSMTKGLPLKSRVAVDNWPHGGANGLVEDCRVSVIRDAMMAAGGPVRDPEAYERLRADIGKDVAAQTRRLVVSVASVIPRLPQLRQEISGWEGGAIDDIRSQLEFMFPPNAVTRHGWTHLQHVDRYLQAIEIRLADSDRDPARDEDLEAEVAEVKDYLDKKLAKLPAARAKSTAVRDIGWQIQEFRVSLFAQRLGTRRSVSAKRIKKAIDQLR